MLGYYGLIQLKKNQLKMSLNFLSQISLQDHETVYGNIGQDLIKQFNKMTMNFDKMFIKFD